MDKRSKYCFGLGAIGRDMFYSLESMYLLFFLTEIRRLDDATLALAGGTLTVLRVLDAFGGDGQKAWFVFAAAVCALMIGFQLVTVFGVRERRAFKEEENTSLRQLALLAFPRLSAQMSRRKLYSIATALVAAGYVAFFFAPVNMIPIAAAAATGIVTATLLLSGINQAETAADAPPLKKRGNIR